MVGVGDWTPLQSRETQMTWTLKGLGWNQQRKGQTHSLPESLRVVQEPCAGLLSSVQPMRE